MCDEFCRHTIIITHLAKSVLNTMDNLLEKILNLMPRDPGLEFPPKVFRDMEGEVIDYTAGQSLTVRFPNKERYENPLGFMQGGMITAAIDNTIGPLSFLLAPPSVTKDLATVFKRPVKRTDKFIEVIASLIEKTSSGMIIEAKVTNAAGKIVAIGKAEHVIVG